MPHPSLVAAFNLRALRHSARPTRFVDLGHLIDRVAGEPLVAVAGEAVALTRGLVDRVAGVAEDQANIAQAQASIAALDGGIAALRQQIAVLGINENGEGPGAALLPQLNDMLAKRAEAQQTLNAWQAQLAADQGKAAPKASPAPAPLPIPVPPSVQPVVTKAAGVPTWKIAVGVLGVGAAIVAVRGMKK